MWWFLKRKLPDEDIALMTAIASGGTLKSHRDIDGHKMYRFYPLNGDARPIPYHQVQRLLDRGLLTTNQKFPAATFLLTSKGQQAIKTKEKPRGIGGIVNFDSKNDES